MTVDAIADSNGISVIARSVATWQSRILHEPGLPRLTVTGDMFRYLLTVSPPDCFTPFAVTGIPLLSAKASAGIATANTPLRYCAGL
jgi:hypothetical protein